MRDIKFRGKRKDNNEWVYGFYYEHQPPLECIGDGRRKKPEAYIINTGFADWSMTRPVQYTEVYRDTVGQYAEKKNKNGKEIYEGDKLRFRDCYNHIYVEKVLEYEYSQFGVSGFDFWLVAERSEIIGNIIENPEVKDVE